MTLIPTQVTFRGLPHSDALEGDVRAYVARLEQFYRGITRCRVLIELPHRHRHSGRHFHVRIELTVPGGAPIVVNHEPSMHASAGDVEEQAHHKSAEVDRERRDAYLAVHEAFHAARRRLESFARERDAA